MLKTVVTGRALDEGAVLAPERYDPRRKLDSTKRVLADMVDVVRHSFEPHKCARGAPIVVFDTGDADRGIIRGHAPPQPGHKIGSTKKIVEPGDVLVSRLRPYLKQVAWVDEGVGGGARLACSTEFFVLRSKVSTESAAFLVPFLLSGPVQQVLCAAQEGGHHPRFNQQTLQALPIPDRVFNERRQMSNLIEDAIRGARRAEAAIELAVRRLSEPRDERPSPPTDGT